MPISSAPSAPALRRALGRWDLTAIGINAVIGGAIFLVPSQVAAEVGGWAPLAYLIVGAASLLVALCFAEAGSRFDRTGGPYLYTRAAFGPFVGFEVGWMMWFTRASSQASIVNGIALALGFYWPALMSGLARQAVVAGLVLGIALITVRGIRQSAWTVNALTIAKLVPLGVFIAAGMLQADWQRWPTLPPVSEREAAGAALLLIFAFGGFDIIGVPAGEARDPRRDLPFASIVTIGVVTIVMTLVHVVAMVTLPSLAEATTPVADAAQVLLGAAGALLVGVGSIASMLGNNAGGVLAGSRVLFALAENGALPRTLAHVHARYRTPSHAVWFTSAVALALALSGSFVTLAAASAVSRLLTYAGVSAATLALRHPRFAGHVHRAEFVIPFGSAVPLLAVAGSIVPILASSARQLAIGGAAIGVGAVIFATVRRDAGR
jgi:basic amino acid/polyamine antiporter, APA family